MLLADKDILIVGKLQGKPGKPVINIYVIIS